MTHVKKHRKSPDKKHAHCRIVKVSPVEVGDELEVNIIEIAPNGDGLTRIQGYVITVHGAKPRDRVKVQITRVGAKTGEAKIIE